jgi:cyclic pyranopterin phosphate synthase
MGQFNMDTNRLNIIAYESNENVYINISNKCTAKCVFCTKRYFAKRYLESLNKNIKINITQYIKHHNKGEILKNLENGDISKYNENTFTGFGEPLAFLDDAIYGYLPSTNEAIYGLSLHLSREPTLEEILRELEKFDVSKYREAVFTGMGDPLMRLDTVLEVTSWLTRKGIPVRLDTIGHARLLYPRRKIAKELAESGMKSVSISLNAHDEEIYNKLCRPELENSYASMFEFASDVIRAGMRLRFTIMNLPIIDAKKCREIAHQYGADFMKRTFF